MFAVVFGKKYAKTNYQPSRCELDFKTILGLHVTSPKIKLGNYRFF